MRPLASQRPGRPGIQSTGSSGCDRIFLYRAIQEIRKPPTNRREPPRDPINGGTDIKLKLKIVPGASRTAIAGWLGDALKIRVAAPPEKNKANKAVVQLLANALGLSVRDIAIVSGHTSAHKTVEIESLDEAGVLTRIAAAGHPRPGP